MTEVEMTNSSLGSATVSLSWRDLSYSVTVDNKDKEIIRGMTGTALPNRLLAVMGGSGAGKTTLLNLLCDRLLVDPTHKMQGTILLNNTKFTDEYRAAAAFVTQDDIVFDMATPEESLNFSARVRCGLNKEDAAVHVDRTLSELGLSHVRHTIIGVPGLVRGLSGGERKRTNIGVELITDPKILMLDEPTSGLDSVTAEKVVGLLRDIARKGRTVLCTIHQPNADIVALFDDLLLLVNGKPVYHGAADEAVEYFRSVGYDCPEHYTPTDYFMTLMQDDQEKQKLIDSWEHHISDIKDDPRLKAPVAADESHTDDVLNHFISFQGGSYGTQFNQLLKRAFVNVMRNKMFVVALFVQAIVFSLIAGIIYVNLGDDQESVQDRQGLFFLVATNLVFSGVTGVINTFPKEKNVFVREQQSNAYSPAIYFMAKTIAELPFHILFPFITCVIIYFMADLHNSAKSFFIFAALNTLASLSAVSMGLCISASVPNYHVATALAPVFVIPMMLVGGLLASDDRTSTYWVWLEKLSLVRYTYIGSMKNEFENVDTITCDADKFGDLCATMFRNGTQVLKAFKLDESENDIWVNFLGLAVILVAFRILAVLALYRIAKTKF